MVDIQKQINYWTKGSEEDFAAARTLIEDNKTRQGLFFLHLSVEKMLKAHVCSKTGDLAPKTHNLMRLTEIAALALDVHTVDLLSDINRFNLEGRYPENFPKSPSLEIARKYLELTESALSWLKNQL